MLLTFGNAIQQKKWGPKHEKNNFDCVKLFLNSHFLRGICRITARDNIRT